MEPAGCDNSRRDICHHSIVTQTPSQPADPGAPQRATGKDGPSDGAPEQRDEQQTPLFDDVPTAQQVDPATAGQGAGHVPGSGNHGDSPTRVDNEATSTAAIPLPPLPDSPSDARPHQQALAIPMPDLIPTSRVTDDTLDEIDDEVVVDTDEAILEDEVLASAPAHPPVPTPEDGGEGAAQAAPRVASDATVVIEGDIAPRRLRRPGDLLRLVIVLLTATVIFGLAYLATGTTSGLDQDLSQASTRVPDFVLVISNTIVLLGVLGLPIGAGIFLIFRKRGRQLGDAAIAFFAALIVGVVLVSLIRNHGSAQLLSAMTGRTSASAVNPLNPLISALVAFITVARLMERARWAVASVVVTGAMILGNIVGNQVSAIGLIESMLLGWAVGLIVRYVRGTPTTRPSGLDVAQALEGSGFPLTVLRASALTRGGRRYSATTRGGQRLDVLVLDRDLEGDGLLPVAWRSIRVREDDGGSGVTMRRRLERGSLEAYAAQVAGAPSPRLLAVSQVGHDASLLAFETIDAEPFANVADDLNDGDLDRAWIAVRKLQDANISHRTLSANNILRDANGGVWLVNGQEGSVAASEVALRIDLAEMLCTQALLTDPDRAIASGIRVLGLERLLKAQAVLQPVALSPATKKAMRKRKDLMVSLRDKLIEANPGAVPEQIRIERLKPRTLITIIAGTFAAYILLSQLAKVNMTELASQANWGWVIPAALLSAATYIGAAMSLSGFVPEKLHLQRTILAQLAASFATLVSPPTLGAVAVNVRYLQRSGVHPALAAASIAVSQVMAFIFHILLILMFGIFAGTQTSHAIQMPPVWAIVIAVALIGGVLLAFVLPWTRGWMRKRVQPILKQVGPRLLTLTQRPLKLAEGIGGILILNIGYCACLYACVRAFGGNGSFAAIAVVYLIGATLGQAAPTPGGIGAVEASLIAFLTAIAGVDAAVAVSSVLLFRLLTLWFPTIPGWFSFNWMTKHELL